MCTCATHYLQPAEALHRHLLAACTPAPPSTCPGSPDLLQSLCRIKWTETRSAGTKCRPRQPTVWGRTQLSNTAMPHKKQGFATYRSAAARGAQQGCIRREHLLSTVLTCQTGQPPLSPSNQQSKHGNAHLDSRLCIVTPAVRIAVSAGSSIMHVSGGKAPRHWTTTAQATSCLQLATATQVHNYEVKDHKDKHLAGKYAMQLLTCCVLL